MNTYTLAIDTSQNHLLIALGCNGSYLDHYFSDTPLSHSKLLHTEVARLLQEHHLNLNTINLWSCVVGPGSFTGIRIGLSAIKAWAFVHQKPVIAINALDLCHKTLKTDKPIWTLLDARHKHVYAKHFPVSNKSSESTHQSILAIAEQTSTAHLFAGSGAIQYKSYFEDHLTKNFELAPTPSDQDMAQALIELSHAQEPTHTLPNVQPLYVLASQPER